MTIKYVCEECGSALNIKDHLAGKPGRCPKCKAEFVVPEKTSGEESAAEPKRKRRKAPAAEPTAVAAADTLTDRSPEIPPEFADDEPPATSAASIASGFLSGAGIPDEAPVKRRGRAFGYDERDDRPPGEEPAVDYAAFAKHIGLTIVPAIVGTIAVVVLTYMGAKRFFFKVGDRPELARVTGTVTIDGEPVAGATLTFQPDPDADPPPKGSASIGRTDNEGRYELTYVRDIEGAVIGQHKVLIETREGRRFRETAEVGPGKNTINFPLKTKP